MSFQFWSLERVTSGGNVQKEIDGLRFIAIFPVVLTHAYFVYLAHLNESYQAQYGFVESMIRNGGTGVHIFFVISGYVLGSIFYKAATENGRQVNINQYFLRRLSRMEPPYLISLIGFLIVSISLGKDTFLGFFDNFLASIFYVHNILYGYGSEINNVAWSLEVEFQFYILAPALYYVYRNPRYSNVIFLVLILGFVVSCFVMGDSYRSILSQGHFFLLGAFLHTCKDQQRLLVALIPDYLAFLFSIGILLVLFQFETLGSGLFSSVSKLLLLLAFFAISLNSLLLSRFLSIRPIYLIGGICYSIYLIHYPLLSFIASTFAYFDFAQFRNSFVIFFIFSALIVLIASILFALFFERPFMVKGWYRKFVAFLFE